MSVDHLPEVFGQGRDAALAGASVTDHPRASDALGGIALCIPPGVFGSPLGPPYLMLVLLPLVAWACAKPAEPAGSPGYGYESVNDPAAEADAAAARLPTSCAHVRCPPPQVCRLLSVSNPGGDAHAYCLLPGDGLCKEDPEICQDSVCRTQPGLCE